jgi:hypothetical protein
MIFKWLRNNRTPEKTYEVQVAEKFMSDNWGRVYGPNLMFTVRRSYWMNYNVAFDAEGAGRLRFKVPRRQYHMFNVGERGQLSFKGTRITGYSRQYRHMEKD